jgi:signal transduction histidine kinase
VLEETVRQMQLLDPQRQISLDMEADLTILGDRDAFKQVTLILLDNALKHSDGDVAVRVAQEHSQVAISVQDHGPGMDSDTVRHVFDRFYRGDDSSIVPGFGLGLPIAKALTEGMGGSIAIESELNQGSTITVRFLAAEGLEFTPSVP